MSFPFTFGKQPRLRETYLFLRDKLAIVPARLRHCRAGFPPIFLPLIVLVPATVLLCLGGWETRISGLFFAEGDASWPYRFRQPWSAIDDYGCLPALVIGIGGLVVALGALVVPALRRWRKAGAFLALALVLGPGLIVNGLLKPYWGRPRPVQLAAFGKSADYAPVWTPAGKAAGRSFPSGHASMGFFLMVPAFLYYRRRRRLALLLFTVGLLAGGIVGFTRVLQGRHFPSDVLWSAACVYYSALFLYVLFRYHRAEAEGSAADGRTEGPTGRSEDIEGGDYREAA
jgi:membrane-associated PAP2 superfamily phosphatase